MCRLRTCFFFFNDTATTEIYTLSLHDALPIFDRPRPLNLQPRRQQTPAHGHTTHPYDRDRKSTRLNSSHGYISYAVFCLKKKNKHYVPVPPRDGLNKHWLPLSPVTSPAR